MARVSKTSIFTGVKDGYEFARQMRRACLITGDAGIGKTFALEEIARLDEEAVYIRIDTFKNTPRAALDLIANRLSFSCSESAPANKIWNILECHFRHPEAKERTLVFDEAQNLPLDTLKELVDLPSRFSIPVVVCGNPDVLKRRRVSDAAFAQIGSRISKRVVLAKPLESDFETIAIDFDVLGKDAHRACVVYGANTSIRDLVEMLETARVYAGKGPLRLEEIKQAVIWNNKIGTNALKLISRVA